MHLGLLSVSAANVFSVKKLLVRTFIAFSLETIFQVLQVLWVNTFSDKNFYFSVGIANCIFGLTRDFCCSGFANIYLLNFIAIKLINLVF